MTARNNEFIHISIHKPKFWRSIVIWVVLIVVMSSFAWAVNDTLQANLRAVSLLENDISQPSTIVDMTTTEKEASYPLSGSELNPNLFSIQLPPPPLDALPYDVRDPLSNGMSVPVKKRWLWVPAGKQITVADDGSDVDIPDGTLVWKEFYLETDRGAFLIERRIIVKVRATQRNPDGWEFYTAHHLPAGVNAESPILLNTFSADADSYVLQPSEWLTTQNENEAIEIRFKDQRGVEYPYIFPGQIQCFACHAGAAGAFPNAPEKPIFAFAFHPNVLTTASLQAIADRGWMQNGDVLLTANYPGAGDQGVPQDEVSFEILTNQVIGMLRNNCASCHNSSPHAAANYSALILEPNRHYTGEELLAALSVSGVMVEDALPLVTPGQLDQSELWLRVNGLHDRRRMPPAEGGVPDIDPRVVTLLERWIIQSGEAK